MSGTLLKGSPKDVLERAWHGVANGQLHHSLLRREQLAHIPPFPACCCLPLLP